MKERYLSKTPFLTFVYLSKCNTKLPSIFGNSKKRFLWTGLLTMLFKKLAICIFCYCRDTWSDLWKGETTKKMYLPKKDNDKRAQNNRVTRIEIDSVLKLSLEKLNHLKHSNCDLTINQNRGQRSKFVQRFWFKLCYQRHKRVTDIYVIFQRRWGGR